MCDREDRRMTKKAILDQCKRNQLFTTPQLNDVLYLHFQGFPKIENLEEYTGLKCLWLESNAISKIEGLDNQTLLRSLFLQNNLITRIENLDNCKELDTLVLSHNYIKDIENCGASTLPVLNTLNISHNQLRHIDGLEILKQCENLSILDLSFNKIEDITIARVLGEMPSLHVLNMTGNPVVSNISNYRKTMILECKVLTYLDSRPVFPRDRACAEAWKRGGFSAEKREHEQWNREERRKVRKSVNALLSKARGETVMLTSDEEQEGEDENCENEEDIRKSKNDESNEDIYDGNQKELLEIYARDEKELKAYYEGSGDANDKKALIEEIECENNSNNKTNDNNDSKMEKIEVIEQKKDEMTKMLDVTSDQNRILNILQINKEIEHGNFIEAKKQHAKKVLIEEISVRDNAIIDSNEMESMLWFDEDVTAASQNLDSIDYQLPIPETIETFAEDITSSQMPSGDFTKVLELCHDQKKDAMQLCFINENDKLMQMYDEAVERKLVHESDVQQLKEIEALCNDDVAEKDVLDVLPNLDGILTVKKLNLQPSTDEDEGDGDDEDVVQFSHVEISEAHHNAENLIDGVIKSLEDIDMPL
jgi:dynein assembly factor 1